MNQQDYKYTVAIRTLGRAGEKFEREINSLKSQTIPPIAINAYIPDGYDIPVFAGSETINWIRSPKGMVRQRALPFDEITTDFILFLDDDIELAPNTVEKLFDPIKLENADAVVANVFENHNGSLTWKIKSAINGTLPNFRKKWGFRVRRSTQYSYCNNPDEYMPSQSGAGACALIRKEAFKKIHFEDELWLEVCGYPFGEDLVFFNKLYQNGFNLYTHFNTGIIHLDAGSSSRIDHTKTFIDTQIMRYLIWYRISFSTKKTFFGKQYAKFCFWSSCLYQSLFDLPRLFGPGKFMLMSRYKGISQGQIIRKSGVFDKVPKYNSYS